MEYQIRTHILYRQGVAEDPSGATDCTTQWNKQPELVILLVFANNYSHFNKLTPPDIGMFVYKLS